VNTDIETLITALYVKIDDELITDRWCGRPPVLSDSELVCLAVAQALLQVSNEAHWLRFVGQRLGHMFPYRPQRPGYNKRLRAALPLVKRAIQLLARDTDFWLDNVWITDSTPVPCGMSRPTVKRSDLAGWASYGYCASHSRYFWGLRLYLVCTPAGMPILWALANAKLGEREVLEAMLEDASDVVAEHPGILMITDKGFSGKRFAKMLKEDHKIELLRPSRKGEKKRTEESQLKSVRQLIESVNDTLKGQLDLEEHGGRTIEGVAVRVATRVLALAAAIWHNFQTGQPVNRSLIAYDH
jgi:hypothetical protein